MTTFAIAGQKGGVGKSTVALSLTAEWLARGRRVLLVDSDPQRTATTWGEVALEQGRPVPTLVGMGATMWQPDQLPRLAAGFDVVIVDTPPRLGDIQRAALMVADVVVLPCGPSAHDCWALAEGLELVHQAQTLRPNLLASVLLTRKVAGTVIGRDARNVLTGTGLPVLLSELGYRTDYQEASQAGQGASTYRPSSAAAAEIRALATELETFAELPASPPANGQPRLHA
jgi:chromosome partitioning protein